MTRSRSDPAANGRGDRGVKRPRSFVGELKRAAKEGRPYRKRVRPSSSKQASVDVRARPTGGACAVLAVARPAPRCYGPCRAPSRPAFRRRAARKAYRLPQARSVTRNREEARLVDAGSDNADGKTFAEFCAEDRHPFRLNRTSGRLLGYGEGLCWFAGICG